MRQRHRPSLHQNSSLVLHKDSENYPATLMDELADFDGCVWALGASSRVMKEPAYMKLTHDFPMSFIQSLTAARQRIADSNSTALRPFRFVYVSGEGADRSEKSSLLFARVKGKAENDLIKLAASSSTNMQAYAYRPGSFYPDHPTDRKETRGTGAGVANIVLSPVLRAINLFVPGMYIPIRGIAAVAIELAKGRLANEEGDGDGLTEVVDSKRIVSLCKTWNLL